MAYTPEMIAFYSKTLGVDYPWAKYAQMTGRDYVSGAMENTTATLHCEPYNRMQENWPMEMNAEKPCAHELFHQWFGDFVTTESWSNITVNESFADYSETLWMNINMVRMQAMPLFMIEKQYLSDTPSQQDLVRFYYEKREDVFDEVSSKKAAILHMLRNYVGDSAFFKSLNLYLTTNKFKSAEAQNLRLAFEEVTGKDLNWFFNQWYYGSGHPKLDIRYDYDDAAGCATVIVKQIQQTGKIFRIPLAIDEYEGAVKTRHMVWIQNAADNICVFV